MVKSPDAFRTIREVAEWLDTPAHVLRFWESRFTQVKPVKRAGGRRYYRPSDMELLGGIKQLLHEDGLTIRGVQKLLREHGVRHVAAKSPALALEPGPASGVGAGGASDIAGRVPPPAARPDSADIDDPAPSPDDDALQGSGSFARTWPRPDETPDAADTAAGPVESGQPSAGDPDAAQATEPDPEPAALPNATPPSADHAHVSVAAVDITSPDTAPPSEAEPGAEALTRQGPLLSDLWERRLSGSLGDTGPPLARARAVLRAMNARD